MTFRGILMIFASTFALVGCEPSPGPFTDDLPNEALLVPGAETVYFHLRVSGETDSRDVVLLNGGLRRVELRDVRIEGRDRGAFDIVSIVPDFPTEREIEPRQAAGIRIQFTSTGRRVNLARLVVESNAGDGEPLEVELVGPGADNPLPAAPDAARVENSTEIRYHMGYDVPVALARFYNLGGDTFEIAGYVLDDDTRFRIVPGTAVPAIACDPSGTCIPEADETYGCCGLACRGTCNGGSWDGQVCSVPCPGDTVGDPTVECTNMTCEAVGVVSGDLAIVPVGFVDPSDAGPYSFTLRADTSLGGRVVTVSGSL